MILQARPPFSLSALARVLQCFPHPFAERVNSQGAICRVVVTTEGARLVCLHSQTEDGIAVSGTTELIPEIFELHSTVRERLQGHPESRFLGEAVALPILRWEESFAAMASTIIEQQNSWVSATRCISALFSAGKRKVGQLSAFPTPAEIMGDPEMVRKLSITNRRKTLLLDLAEHMQSVPDYLDQFCLDLETAESRLVKLSGIGPWTARVFLSKRYGYRPKVPINDVALQRAAARFILAEERKMEPTELADHLQVFQELAGEAAQRLLLRWVLETYPANKA